MESKTLLRTSAKFIVRIALAIATLIVLGAFVWQGITASGNPDPTIPSLQDSWQVQQRPGPKFRCFSAYRTASEKFEALVRELARSCDHCDDKE